MISTRKVFGSGKRLANYATDARSNAPRFLRRTFKKLSGLNGKNDWLDRFCAKCSSIKYYENPLPLNTPPPYFLPEDEIRTRFRNVVILTF